MAFVAATIPSMLSKHMALIFQMKQCPEVMVSPEINTSSVTPIAPVRPAIRLVLGMAQVHRTASTFSGAAVYLYIVYEI